ncbi:hypothetical protein T06_6995 [Trichinella sp. T6]|nr:hypothetical protein T06_6995 [Trichinella sp. T6]
MNNGKFIKAFSDNWPLYDDGGGEQTIGTSGSVIQAGACQIRGWLCRTTADHRRYANAELIVDA